ncbi:MAG: T9SS type A sorting domain-containing protein [Bacteroidetes bacterium]|nr:T9SS type A sorting domain-containing protein [Bacteroidota bacterium]
MLRRLLPIAVLIGTAVTAAVILHFSSHDDTSSFTRKQDVRAQLKAERKADIREGRNLDHPRLDWYIAPRVLGSEKGISQGLREAVDFRADQNAHFSLRKESFANTWTFIGPNNIAGRVRVVKFHPTDPNIAYAGSASGGLFKSTDGGTTWTAKTDQLSTLAIGHMAFDPVNHDIIYIATGEGSNNWDKVYGDGIYKSTDAGETWTNIMKDVIRDVDLAVNHLAIHPDDPDLIFAATTHGGASGALMRTTDGGENWKAVLNGPARSVIIDKARPDRVIVGFGYYNGRSSNGLYYSDERGDRFTFTRIMDNIPEADSIGRVVLDASLNTPGTIICVMHRAPKHTSNSRRDFLGIFRSTDSGDNWEKLPSSEQISMREFLRGQGDYNLYIRYHPTDPDVVFVGGINTWRSTDGGLSFRQVTTQSGMAGAWVDMHYADFSPTNPDIMLLASDGGVFRTNDCRRSNITMEEVGTGLATMQFYSMNYDRQQTSRVAGGTQDRRNNIGIAPDPVWQQLVNWGGDGGWVAFDYENQDIFYIAYQYGRLGKTTNGGTTFFAIQNGLTLRDGDNNYMFSFVTPFIMHPTDKSHLVVGGNRIYRTTNSGAQWIPISGNLTNQTSSLSQFQHLAFCKNNPDVLYGVTGYSARAFRTTNAMAAPDNVEWTRIDAGLPRLFLGEVAVHPVNGDIAYVGTAGFSSSSGVYMTTDGGESWEFMKGETPETSLPDIPVGALSIYEKNPDIIFAGTDIGIYVSRDAGLNWQPFGEGLPTVVIDDIRITGDDIIYAATHGRGMWMSSAVLSTEQEAERMRPLMFDLGQNYPNPLAQGSSTVLPFTLERPSSIQVRIYDLQGRVVRTLLDEQRMAGTHQITVNAEGLNAGAYFYELRAGNHREVRKMVIVQ